MCASLSLCVCACVCTCTYISICMCVCVEMCTQQSHAAPSLPRMSKNTRRCAHPWSICLGWKRKCFSVEIATVGDSHLSRKLGTLVCFPSQEHPHFFFMESNPKELRPCACAPYDFFFLGDSREAKPVASLDVLLLFWNAQNYPPLTVSRPYSLSFPRRDSSIFDLESVGRAFFR